ncbi:MAG: multiprotein-bridging factor 1 family protein [Candidatus Micrarchaeota archaeon]
MRAPDCYICGKAAVVEAIVEGARVQLCGGCMKYGTPISKPTGVSRPVSSTSMKTASPASPPIRHEFSVIEGYGGAVQRARESMGLTRHELAATLFISENIIERIEHEALKPDHKIAEKLEKFLKIKLLQEDIPGKVDKLKEDLLSDYRRKGSGSYTVADAINIKMKKK